MARLSSQYRDGIAGVAIDHKQSLMWYAKLSIISISSYAICASTHVHRLTRAAERSIAYSCRLGTRYYHGDDTCEASFDRAVECWRRAVALFDERGHDLHVPDYNPTDVASAMVTYIHVTLYIDRLVKTHSTPFCVIYIIAHDCNMVHRCR
jgi:hypothetical protein